MISENMFLDVIADADPDFVEEVLFMPQLQQDSRDLQKYRKKSSFGRIFGSVAACLAVIGVGITAVVLNNRGFFDKPYASETTAVSAASDPADPDNSDNAVSDTESTVQSTESRENTASPYDYQELVIALERAVNGCDTFKELFAEISRINTDAGGLITGINIYESSEAYAEGNNMSEEKLTGKIGYGTIFKIQIGTGETDYVEIAKISLPGGETAENLPQGLMLEGIEGDVISRSDMTAVEFLESKPDVWSTIVCDFAYLAQPKGISYNSIDHKDMFDEANWFSGNIGTNDSDYEYKRYYAGDKIGDLTVSAAEISFWNMSEENVSDQCRKSMNVSFDGTVTLTGYLVSYTSEDGFINSVMRDRAVYFAPDSESGKKLPVFKGFNTPTELTLINDNLSDNFGFYGEHCKIDLRYSDDFSDFPDNQAVKVKITISNLNYRYAQGGPVSSFANADPVSCEVTD
ncbi:MAG: hypothetical protein NC228_01675 [[Eubacterium] siraeum]|nr:hypothetical protein [[Eubacterium] siraeum]